MSGIDVNLKIRFKSKVISSYQSYNRTKSQRKNIYFYKEKMIVLKFNHN